MTDGVLKKMDMGEIPKARNYILIRAIICLVIFFVGIPVLTSLMAVLRYGSHDRIMDMLASYWGLIATDITTFINIHLDMIRPEPKKPIEFDIRILVFPIELFGPFFLASALMVYFAIRNPYSFTNTAFGSARFARDDDIERMGLISRGYLVVMGEWKKKFLRLPETLSVLCVAPPGTGKTVSVVVPTILEAGENISMVVNDVKPELFDITSGYRQQFSHCYRLEWAAKDEPENGKFYPRWNPLSPMSMPAPGPNRDLYIDRLVNVLVEENEKDPHWSTKGRASLTGLIHLICAKVENKNYKNIPEEWHGKEASIPMLIDWWTQGQDAAREKMDELRASNPMAAMSADPMRDFLNESAGEAKAYRQVYGNRAQVELVELANTPDKERGSILSTMMGGLVVFKNSAVIARTSACDFSLRDFRGIKDPKTGKWNSMTIYVCVNQEDARALGKITALLVEALASWLVAHKPGSMTRDGHQVGPCHALFVLDEFPQMPKLQALIDGPAVGRGQKVSFLMIGQDLGQIKAKYGENDVETVMSTTAAKVILPLNNETAAKRFSEMVGQRTLETKSRSRTMGMSRETNPFAANVQRSLQGQPLLRPEDFMTIPKGKHYILYQGEMSRPILCDTAMYFLHPKLKHLVNKENGGNGKYEPAPTMPKYMIESRTREWQEEERTKD